MRMWAAVVLALIGTEGRDRIPQQIDITHGRASNRNTGFVVTDEPKWSTDIFRSLDDGPNYTPNRVVIRLSESNPEEAIFSPYSKRKESHRRALDRIEKQYGIRTEAPVFRSLHRNLERSLADGRDLDITRVDQDHRRKFATRSRRALQKAGSVDLLPYYVLELANPNANVLKKCASLAADPEIASAEPDYIVTAFSTPNDPLASQQWALSNEGQLHPGPFGGSGYGRSGADIDAPKAWDVYAPTNDVVVAVIDSGVDYNHPDLIQNMWTDANGRYGYDFLFDSFNPMDVYGHGTFVSGVIAATHGNNEGIAGVCPNAKIMALRFLNDQGRGRSSDAADAVYYAVANGADVISNSWGSTNVSEPLQTAFQYAYDQGVLLVAAAGNSNSSIFHYPAAYDNILAVAATDDHDRKASFSNYGSWIDLSAPGLHVLSLIGGAEPDGYGVGSGTSAACPHVAGALALLAAQHPTWTVDRIYEQVRATADDISSYNLDHAATLGTGRLNVRKTFEMSPRPTLRISGIQIDDLVGNSNQIPEPGETVQVTLELENIWLDAIGAEVHISSEDEYLTLHSNTCTLGDLAYRETGICSFSFDVSAAAPLPRQLLLELTHSFANAPDETRPFMLELAWPWQTGWPRRFATEPSVGEVLLADLDDDGETEVLIGAFESLHVFRRDGMLFSSAWPIQVNRHTASYALANVDTDSHLEIVGFRTDHAPGPNENIVYALNIDGTNVLGAWPLTLSPSSLGQDGNITIGDLDWDGTDELLVTSFRASDFHVLKGDATSYGNAWPLNLEERAVRHVTVSDIDTDGVADFVISVGGASWASTHEVRAYHDDGTSLRGWPYVLSAAPLTAPVVGDVDGNGLPDVVFTTYSNELYVLSSSGDLLNSNWPVQLPVAETYRSVALADLDRDGAVDILVAGESPYILAMHADGTMLPGWPATVTTASERAQPYFNHIHSVADLDGDHFPEVIVGGHGGVYIFKHNGSTLVGAGPVPIRTEHFNTDYPGTISVGDIDSDDRVELVAAIAGSVYVLRFNGRPDDIQWARYRSDNGNTGAYPIKDCNLNRIADKLDIARQTSRDCNLNNIPDECGRAGDADGDGDTDLLDHAVFVAISGGPTSTTTCSVLDVDSDDDVDLVDYGSLQRSFAY